MEIRPLSPVMGAEITGVDLRHDIDAPTMERIVGAFGTHRLLLFRNQEIDEDQQAAFTTRFGPLSHQGDNMKHGGKVMFISNTRADGALPNGELLFHSDHAFYPHPLKALCLYAMEVPSQGGETIWLDAQMAYDQLSAPLKARIEGLHAEHAFDYSYKEGNHRVTLETLSDSSVRATHPIAWPHPETGKKILFVNRLMSFRVLELERAEGEALLQALFAHLDNPGFQFMHAWRRGDYILWDNRCLQHARRDFDPAQKRTLRRVPIGETATAAVNV